MKKERKQEMEERNAKKKWKKKMRKENAKRKLKWWELREGGWEGKGV